MPYFFNEDWGWWLQTEGIGFRMGLCIYSDPDADPNRERCALVLSIREPRQWSWSRIRWIDRSQEVIQIIEALGKIFTSDANIRTVTRHDDYPS
ncbi:hypothetical protein KBZ08_09615 [Cyanobium sp. Candia 9D4]|uniref:hypothetical protein n=1 Tax=Cyanobium sp. Candia 9D4 TaxID=2823707 RepID=UPI0020CDC9A9|nr:hypothetical protein [Cyanobium sp. Candia 9D4]MCP9934169.1 hypothetical protein [Cyanobium sp. Candia 9D4]